MTEEEQLGSRVSSQYPPPPVFYKSYGMTMTATASGPHVNAVSLDPPPPPDKEYQCYGDTWQVRETIRSLKEEGVEQLFEEPVKSPAAEIKRLVRASIKIYADLLKIDLDEEVDPTKFDQDSHIKKSIELETHFKNILFLVNHYRPHQAREQLINMLRQQVTARKQSAAKLKQLINEGRIKIMQYRNLNVHDEHQQQQLKTESNPRSIDTKTENSIHINPNANASAKQELNQNVMHLLDSLTGTTKQDKDLDKMDLTS
mmetsp:Transcript_5781/g.7298  ORF Transcript_5781/g.7298 Transcript_5781/m.7298 type:complete len:258 (+) Transcript_5781:226-999(+)|eukprot:CAMPEP_0204851500 /NCGR_PEP_ID=MMETSP1347-20130617/10117_1 /ASSEMBLY_ACC=CAM_ASM_000690 /TAXON_ID=215587 /ORGANISM="Aplanochytrium stocchinoi, Strain GSBS06" /LENGTH=257 /DNA_ID=CAMNT_0051995207 /DNA_START=73 /DNA_END=846 /DNA_ORIENTATION=-